MLRASARGDNRYPGGIPVNCPLLQPESTQIKAIKVVIRFIRDKRLLTITDAFRAGAISLGS